MFTRKFKIPDYNWEVEMYDPTEEEAIVLGTAYDARDWSKVYSLLPNYITKWNCTDRQGTVLAIDTLGVAKLPSPALRWLVLAYFKAVYAEPKNTLAS